MSTIKNENMLKLRELTEKITFNYDAIFKEINNIINEVENNVINLKDDQTRVKYYKGMCKKINNTLKKVNF